MPGDSPSATPSVAVVDTLAKQDHTYPAGNCRIARLILPTTDLGTGRINDRSPDPIPPGSRATCLACPVASADRAGPADRPRRPVGGRGPAAPGAPRAQPAGATEEARPAAAPAAAVPQHPAVRDARRRRDHRHPRPLGRHRRAAAGGAGQRHHRLHPGRQGGIGAGRHPRHALAARHRGPQRPAPRDRRRRPGPRRPGAARLGRPRAGRPAPGRGQGTARRGGRADRRVAAGREERRQRGRRRPAGRPPRHGLVGHPGSLRTGQRPGGGHRRGHRTRQDQPDALRHPQSEHAAAAPGRPLRPHAGAGHPGAVGRHLRARHPVARPCAGGNVHDGRRPRRLGDPRGPAGDHDRHPRPRRAAHGPAQRHRPPPAGGGGAGLGHHHLLGQDRHPDPQRDDRAARGLRRPRVRRRRRGLCAGGRPEPRRAHRRGRALSAAGHGDPRRRAVQRRPPARGRPAVARGGRSHRRRPAGARRQDRLHPAAGRGSLAAPRLDSLRVAAPLHGHLPPRRRRRAMAVRQGRAGAGARHVRGAARPRRRAAAGGRLLAAHGHRHRGPGPAPARPGLQARRPAARAAGVRRHRVRLRAAGPGRHHRPAARGGHARRRRLPPGRHPREDDHRRPCRDRPRHRRAAGHRRGQAGAHRRRGGADGRCRPAPGGDGSGRVRPRQPRAQAAPGTGAAGRRPGGGDDRRRRQRRPGAQARRRRRGDGPQGHRGGQGGRRHGAGRRQLRHHRQRGSRGPRGLRQHQEVHPVHAAHQRRRGAGGDRRHPLRAGPAAHPRAGAVDQHGHLQHPGPGTGLRAGRARHHAPPPAAGGRGTAVGLLRLAGADGLGADDDRRARPVPLGAGRRHQPGDGADHGGQRGGGGGDVLPAQQPLHLRPGARPRRPARQPLRAAGHRRLHPLATGLHLRAVHAGDLRLGRADPAGVAQGAGRRPAGVLRGRAGEAGDPPHGAGDAPAPRGLTIVGGAALPGQYAGTPDPPATLGGGNRRADRPYRSMTTARYSQPSSVCR
ncbi:conserved hypothetical protein [Pseudomonas sp. OF001]|nr:conserved hypothetical protein [Pseudomonas sp. OF001]